MFQFPGVVGNGPDLKTPHVQMNEMCWVGAGTVCQIAFRECDSVSTGEDT